MDINVITQLIGSLGFPMFVAVYTMTTMNKTLTQNTEAINNMSVAITKLADKVHGEE